jgi:cobalamin biosynthesis protein CobD/CbiB
LFAPLSGWDEPRKAISSLLALVAFFLLLRNFINDQRRFSYCMEFGIFCLLLVPIIELLLSVPLREFNYAAFLVPLAIFLPLYLLSIWLKAKELAKAV